MWFQNHTQTEMKSMCNNSDEVCNVSHNLKNVNIVSNASFNITGIKSDSDNGTRQVMFIFVFFYYVQLQEIICKYNIVNTKHVLKCIKYSHHVHCNNVYYEMPICIFH